MDRRWITPSDRNTGDDLVRKKDSYQDRTGSEPHRGGNALRRGPAPVYGAAHSRRRTHHERLLHRIPRVKHRRRLAISQAVPRLEFVTRES
jgi:hypothetical protein